MVGNVSTVVTFFNLSLGTPCLLLLMVLCKFIGGFVDSLALLLLFEFLMKFWRVLSFF